MAVGVELKLPRVGGPVLESLGLALQHQVVIVLQTTDGVAPEGGLRPGQPVLGVEVDIRPRQIHAGGRLIVVHVRLHAIGQAVLGDVRPELLPLKVKVVGDELVRAAVLLDDPRLPGQETPRPACA